MPGGAGSASPTKCTTSSALTARVRFKNLTWAVVAASCSVFLRTQDGRSAPPPKCRRTIRCPSMHFVLHSHRKHGRQRRPRNGFGKIKDKPEHSFGRHTGRRAGRPCEFNGCLPRPYWATVNAMSHLAECPNKFKAEAGIPVRKQVNPRAQGHGAVATDIPSKTGCHSHHCQ